MNQSDLNERMPLPEFARRLGISDERARERVRAEEFSFAKAVPPKVKHGKWSFEIIRKRAEAYFSGIDTQFSIDYDLLAEKLAERIVEKMESRGA